jgi:hypothetical protein
MLVAVNHGQIDLDQAIAAIGSSTEEMVRGAFRDAGMSPNEVQRAIEVLEDCLAARINSNVVHRAEAQYRSAAARWAAAAEGDRSAIDALVTRIVAEGPSGPVIRGLETLGHDAEPFRQRPGEAARDREARMATELRSIAANVAGELRNRASELHEGAPELTDSINNFPREAPWAYAAELRRLGASQQDATAAVRRETTSTFLPSALSERLRAHERDRDAATLATTAIEEGVGLGGGPPEGLADVVEPQSIPGAVIEAGIRLGAARVIARRQALSGIARLGPGDRSEPVREATGEAAIGIAAGHVGSLVRKVYETLTD